MPGIVKPGLQRLRGIRLLTGAVHWFREDPWNLLGTTAPRVVLRGAGGFRRPYFSIPAGWPGAGCCFLASRGDGGGGRLRGEAPAPGVASRAGGNSGEPDNTHGRIVRSCRSKETRLRCSQRPWQAEEQREPSRVLWTPKTRQIRLPWELIGAVSLLRHVFPPRLVLLLLPAGQTANLVGKKNQKLRRRKGEKMKIILKKRNNALRLFHPLLFPAVGFRNYWLRVLGFSQASPPALITTCPSPPPLAA